MNGLQIGKAIKTILDGMKNVFPLVADEGTTYPFIVYRRSALVPASTKDRYSYQELATVEVIAASNSYPESIAVAEQVRQKMEMTRGTFNGINIGEISLTNADEDFIEDTFLQKLTFNIIIL